ncbi:MAG: cation:proton antiporter [Acidobacteriota bacterium]
MDVPILKESVIILAASIVIFFISHKLKLPAVGGFLSTGILIGPSGLRLIKDAHRIDALAEIGVVMLLFTIGIEFSLERLKQIKKNFLMGGGLQVLITTFMVLIILQFFHFSVYEGIFYGFLISLSSTAVVLKIYSDRAEIDSPQGKISLGILLFQDFGIVPMIVLTPILGRVISVSLVNVFSRFFLSALAVGGIILIARYLMPKVLHFIVKTRVREAFIITTLFLCLGMAFLTFSFGFSLALGAFIAGIIISESEYTHQVVSDIMPFKDLFNSIFFISIGMLLDLGFAWKEKFFIIILSLSIFLIKSIVVFSTVKIMKFTSRIALITGLSLAQIGEFSFVLAKVGQANGFLPQEIFQAFIASSILTILATPFLIQLSPFLAEKSQKIFRWKFKPSDYEEKFLKDLKTHVIIAGYGLNGQNLARVLKETGIPYVILDLNPDNVRNALREGEPIIFGDVSSREILNASGITQAKVIVFAISDPKTTRTAVKIARHFNKNIYIIVRTRYVTEIDELYRLGANQVIPEEFETSIEIFTRTLEEFHIPRNIIDAQIKIIRSERYGMLRGISKTARSMEKITELLTAGTAETFFVSKDSMAAGKSLKELNLRQETGATVIGIVRGEKSFTSPPPEFKIKEGDTLILVASHQDMDKAFKFLSPEQIE